MFDRARAILRGGLLERVFPGAAVEVGTATAVLWRDAVGRHTYEPDSRVVDPDTVFDLASLTKVLATTPLVLQLVERGVLGLDDRVAGRLPGWLGEDRRGVTLRDLLSHSSGLPAHRPYYTALRGRPAYEAAICAEPLASAPGTASVYSDLGFMLLGFLVEDAGGMALGERFQRLAAQLAPGDRIQFTPPAAWQADTAPGVRDALRGRVLLGEVDDQNAWALGGVAGHAGLFGTAAAVGAFARHHLQVLGGRTGLVSRPLMAEAVSRREGIPGSSRALGWDTMLPTSSCGTRLSARAFGHTGFTGTSLWIDPVSEIYVVLLANRLHPDGPRDGIQSVRAAFHDAVIDARALTP